MYEKVLPGAVLPAAIILPNTGSNRVLAFITIAVIVIGVAVAISVVARFIAKRSLSA